MSERNHTPPEQNDDVFAEIADRLDGHVTDPFLDEVHGMAQRYQAELRGGEVTQLRQHQMIQDLNERWQEYAGRKVKVSGGAWVQLPGYDTPVQQYYDEQTGVSGGFTTFTLVKADGEVKKSIAHHLIVDTLQARIPAIMPLDDIHHLELPYPSDELRLRRFAYNYPAEAHMIHELVATATRPDQLLRDLQEFSLTVDLDSPEGIEHARDCEIYLNAIAKTDTLANYIVELVPGAPVQLPSGDDLLVYTGFPKGYTMALHCNQLVLRPSDTRSVERTGTQELALYVAGQILLPEANQEVFIPCSSIAQVYSLRYGGHPSTLKQGGIV